MKKCTKCKEEKELSYFNKDKNKKDGLYPSCRECVNNTHKKLYLENPEKFRKRANDYYHNVEGYKEKSREYNKVRAPIKSKQMKIWRQLNKESILKYKNKYEKDRKSRDPLYKARINLRNRLRLAIISANAIKSDSSYELLGCTNEELKIYLEALFKEGMTWDNYGRKGWHIDHIIPCCSFDLTQPEQQRKCFHYTNLQPLWWYENCKKGGKITHNHEVE